MDDGGVMSCLNVVQDYTLEFPITNTRVIYGKICYVTKPETFVKTSQNVKPTFLPFSTGEYFDI